MNTGIVITIFIALPILFCLVLIAAMHLPFYRHKRKARAYVRSLSESKKRHADTSISIDEL